MSFSKKRLRRYINDILNLAKVYVTSRDPERAAFALGKFETAICVGAQLNIFKDYPKTFVYNLDYIRGCDMVGPWDIKEELDLWRTRWFDPCRDENDVRGGITLIDQFKLILTGRLQANMTPAVRKVLGVQE